MYGKNIYTEKVIRKNIKSNTNVCTKIEIWRNMYVYPCEYWDFGPF